MQKELLAKQTELQHLLEKKPRQMQENKTAFIPHFQGSVKSKIKYSDLLMTLIINTL